MFLRRIVSPSIHSKIHSLRPIFCYNQIREANVLKRRETLNPAKLPTVNPELYHEQALERVKIDKEATGLRHVPDLDKLWPEVPTFISENRPVAWVKNLKDEYTDLIDLDPYLFQCPPRKDILHKMVVWQLAKKRQGTHKTKYRLEVAYTKRKMYSQKGTGRARHKDFGANIFIGGGRAFPKRPRDYSFKLNKKFRRLALRMALTTKYEQDKLLIIEDTNIEQPKTKIAKKILEGLGVDEKGGALIIDSEVNRDFELATFNLGYIHVLPAAGINVFDMLRLDKLIITRSGLQALSERYKEYARLRE